MSPVNNRRRVENTKLYFLTIALKKNTNQSGLIFTLHGYKKGSPLIHHSTLPKNQRRMNVVIRLTALALLLSIFGLVSGAKKVKVTKAQQKVLLKGHNDLRSTLANGKAVNQNDTYLPSGQNIYKMVSGFKC